MLNGHVPKAKWGTGLTRIGRVSHISERRNPRMSELGETLRHVVQPNYCM